jgi:hypothetical protein
VKIVKIAKNYGTTGKTGKHREAPTRERTAELETVRLIINGKLHALTVGQDIETSHTLARWLLQLYSSYGWRTDTIMYDLNDRV